MTRIVVVLLLPCLPLFRCGFSHTGDVLSGATLDSDKNPVSLYSPVDNGATSAIPSFSWSSKPLPIYTIEISTKSDFMQLILNKKLSTASYTLSTGDLIGMTALDSVTYYWRVRSGSDTNYRYSVANAFNVRDGKVYYVAPPAGNAAGAAGNKSAPFPSIALAITTAESERGGDPAKPVEIRVAAGTYTEYVQPLAGISLYGGYEKTGWTRNITANTTTIQAPSGTAVYMSSVGISYQASTVVDGFSITVPQTGGDLVGIWLAQAAPKISNCTINISNGIAGKDAYGVYVGGSSNPLIQRNVVSVTANAGVSSAVYSNASSGRLVNNAFSTSTSGGTLTAGVYLVSGATGEIQANLIKVTAGATTSGYGIYGHSGSPSLIQQNVIYLTTPGTTNAGIDLKTPAAITISNNTIFVETTTVTALTVGIQFSTPVPMSAIATTVVSNIVAVKNVAPSLRINFQNQNSILLRPAAMNNNVFLDGGGGGSLVFYRDSNGPTDYYDICGGLFYTGPACGGMTYAATPTVANRNGTNILTTFGGATLNISNLKSWIIAANGPADVDLSGGYSTGDAGANAAAAGP